MVELDLLGALVAAVQALIFTSLVYFLYLVLKFGELSHTAGQEDGGSPTRAHGVSFITAWLGEAEHGRPGVSQSGAALRFRDSA